MNRMILLASLFASTAALASDAPGATTTDAPAVEAPQAPIVESPKTDASLPTFAALDTNLDAKLDLGEVADSEILKTEFTSVDADKDGKLNRTEFDAWVKVHEGSKDDMKKPEQPKDAQPMK